jgi:HNH endonuclease
MKRSRDIPGWEGLYSITEDGEVYNHRTGRWLSSTNYNAKQRAQVALYRDGIRETHFIHILILQTYTGPRPPNMKGLHVDDNPKNNTWSNLVWGTHQDNMIMASENDRFARGERNSKAKLTADQIEDLIKRRLGGETTTSLARYFKISVPSVTYHMKGVRI